MKKTYNFKKIMQKKEKTSGVTLIILVITIIVLLIILSASVAISSVSIKQTKENKLLTELGILNHAALQRYTKVTLTGESYPGITITDANINLDGVLQDISNKTGENITRKDNDDNNYYYLTNGNGGLKSLGIKDSEDEYIINYQTGEVINYSKRTTDEGKPLYIYSVEK